MQMQMNAWIQQREVLVCQWLVAITRFLDTDAYVHLVAPEMAKDKGLDVERYFKLLKQLYVWGKAQYQEQATKSLPLNHWSI